jgi:hypothetical protein
MSFDLRRASREELDAINDRARAWKAKQSSQPEHEQTPTNTEAEQLDLFSDADNLQLLGPKPEES